MTERESRILRNYEDIKRRLAAAAKGSGREPEAVTLVAVTKNVPVQDMRVLLGAGIAAVGENRVQEAKQKFAQIGPAASWHLLGHLQTNKARTAAAIFDVVESLDSPRAAEALDRAARGLDRQLDVLIEVNIAAEEQKFGIAPEATRTLVRQVAKLEQLRLRGLMAMAPYVADPELTRPFFRRLAALFAELRGEVGRPEQWNVLSMGMTNDFEVAIAEGATQVRIGTGLFRERSDA